MTSIGTYIYGGLGPVSLAPSVEADEKAKPADPLTREQVFTAWNGLGFEKAPPLSDLVCWRMRRYSACVLAYSVMAGPIFAGTRTATLRNADATSGVPVGVGVQVTETPEEKRRKLVDDVFEDQWPDVLDGLESYNFGRWTQEVIWDRKLGVVAPVGFRSFLPWDIELQRDKFNVFAGFKHRSDVRDARYAFHAVCQPQFDPIFGVPRAENARDAWWRATLSHENADKIERKASGIQMMLELPTGSTFVDKDGNPVLTREMVQTIMNAAVAGHTFTVPIPWKKEDIKANPALAEIPLIRVKEFDWGETGPSLIAAISRLDRLDKEIFRSWHRPEREAMEGLHGTKAEAGVHGQVGITDSEKVHGDFLRQFNRQVVNRFLVTNFGPDAADSIYFKPAPLADPQQSFKQQVAAALLASLTAGPEAQAHLDKRRLMKDTELPLVPEGQVVVPPPISEPDEAEDEDELALSAGLALNCGTGAGGFQPGNECAKGGGQARAKAGGEEGPNGEWYPGGAFIATTDMPKKQRLKLDKMAKGRRAVEPGKFEVPPPGQLPIYHLMRPGTLLDPRSMQMNQQAAAYLKVSPEGMEQWQDLRARYEAGERYVDGTEHGELLFYDDMGKMAVDGVPIPGKALDHMAKVRGTTPEDLQKELGLRKYKRAS